MTRTEFHKLFHEVCEKCIKATVDEAYLTEVLSKYADENGKISTNDLVTFVFIECTKLNTSILLEILDNVLEFDE